MLRRIVGYFTAIVVLIGLSSCHKNADDVRPQTNAVTVMRTTTTVARGPRLSLEFIRSIPGHNQYVFYVKFSPSGELLASGSADNTVRIWNYSTGTELKRIKERYLEIWGIPVDYSPDGHYLVIGSYETLKVLDATKDYEAVASKFAHKGGIQSLVVTPDSQQVITVGVDGNLSVWDIETLQLIKTVKAHSVEIWNVCINPAGTLLITGAEDSTAKIWNFPSLELKREIRYHSYPIEYVRFSRDGNKFLLASADGTVSVWRTSQLNDPMSVLRGHIGSVLVATFSADGNYVFSGGDDDDIYVFEANSGNIIDRYNEHMGDVMSLAVSPNGKFLASGSRDKTIKIWSIKYE